MATEGVTLRGHYLVSKFKRCTHKKKKKCKIEVACEIKDIEKKNMPLGGLPRRNILKGITTPHEHSRRSTFNLTSRPFNKHLISDTQWSIVIGLHRIITSARNKYSYLNQRYQKKKQTNQLFFYLQKQINCFHFLFVFDPQRNILRKGKKCNNGTLMKYVN